MIKDILSEVSICIRRKLKRKKKNDEKEQRERIT